MNFLKQKGDKRDYGHFGWEKNIRVCHTICKIYFVLNRKDCNLLNCTMIVLGWTLNIEHKVAHHENYNYKITKYSEIVVYCIKVCF